jgi:hypothetical protein
MHAVATTPVGLPGLHRSYSPVSTGLPRYPIGSAPTLYFSRPAQRSLALRPACARGRLSRPFSSECFSEIRYLLSPPRLLPAGATSCRVGLSPTGDRRLCTAHRIVRINGVIAISARYQTFPRRRRPLEKPPRNLYTGRTKAPVNRRACQRRASGGVTTGARAAPSRLSAAALGVPVPARSVADPVGGSLEAGQPLRRPCRCWSGRIDWQLGS